MATEIGTVNWKKMISECHELKRWLDEQECGDSDRTLLKVLILSWRGHLTPEDVVGQALAISSLQQAVGEITLVPNSCELPDSINDLIARWSHNLPREAWLLGELYERLAVGKRARGLFYTAPEIVEFILFHTVEGADIVANPYVRVLDPACGCGIFLLKAYDVLWRKFILNRDILASRYPKVNWSDEGIHRHIISHNLWGADIDSIAVDITAACLLLKRPEASSNIHPNLVVCDSLRRPGENTASADRAFWSAYYDFVVGNPPYLSFGLRGAGRLDPDYEGYLRQAFRASAEYKLSYYVLFMERGIEMLTEGGKLGFIVPDSFLLGRYYSKIRRYILEHTAIEVLAHIASPVFKQAAVGMSAVCVLAKRSNSATRVKQLVTVYQVEGKDTLRQDAGSNNYSQSYFATLPYNRFRIFSDLTVKNLIDKIDNSGAGLEKFSSGHTGVRSQTKQSNIVADSPQGDTWRRGLVSGGQIRRYGLEYRGHWLNIDPGLLYKGGWDPAVVEGRKILIRQTGYTLTACIDESSFYHLNNIHSFILKNSDVNLDYILLLLNSRLMSFYYHAVSMEYGRAMAQTDIDTLELLPVSVKPEASNQAPELVGLMQTLVKRQIAGETMLHNKIVALDDLLNQIVYQVYDLTDAEVACIERYEAKLTVRSRQTRGVTGLK